MGETLWLSMKTILTFILRNLPLLAVNVASGLVYARLVYRNMMRSSRPAAEEPGAAAPAAGTARGGGIVIRELSAADRIPCESRRALDCYKAVSRAIGTRLLFIIGSGVFFCAILAMAMIPALSGTGFARRLAFLFGAYCVYGAALVVLYFRDLSRARKEANILAVLRVFGSRARTRFLFSRIVHAWNHIGASFTIMDPIHAKGEFGFWGSPKNFLLKLVQVLSFVAGAWLGVLIGFENPFLYYLATAGLMLAVYLPLLALIARIFFVKDAPTLRRRIYGDARRPRTWYGTGKQMNLYCFDDIWKKALEAMLDKASVVIMDLRGFSDARKGCAFELSYLLRSFDLGRVLFLTDRTTDIELVRRTLESEAERIGRDSPNYAKEELRAALFFCERQDRETTRKIIQALCNDLGRLEAADAKKEALEFRPRLPFVKAPDFFLILAFLLDLFLSLFLISYFTSEASQLRAYVSAQDVVVAPPPQPLAFFELPTLSMTTSDEEPHFLKLTVSLGFDGENKAIVQELHARADQILYMIRILASTSSYESLNNVESAIQLSEAIKAHVNQNLRSGKIKEVYFKDFIVN